MTLDEGEFRRQLHFLNFGDQLHDELVGEWALYSGTLRAINLMLFEDHSFFTIGGEGLYLMRVSVLDLPD